MMLLSLVREESANGWTLGKLAVDGRFQCYTCEDVVRSAGDKVYGKTAIPAGRYRIIVNRSDRFSRLAGRDVLLPLLVGVQGFEGVRIHPGNTAEDTEGCILPGNAIGDAGVLSSRPAFISLLEAIQSALRGGEQVWIEIRSASQKTPPG